MAHGKKDLSINMCGVTFPNPFLLSSSPVSNTAEMVGLSNDPAVKAIAPRSSDFDMFDDLVYPNGVPNLSIIRDWGNGNVNKDRNVNRGNPPVGVRPVDADRDGSLLASAVRSHSANPRVSDAAEKITFRDDVPPLLRTGLAYDPDEVWAWLHDAILTKLPGEQWLGGGGTPCTPRASTARIWICRPPIPPPAFARAEARRRLGVEESNQGGRNRKT
jgi:hypothetical protein